MMLISLILLFLISDGVQRTSQTSDKLKCNKLMTNTHFQWINGDGSLKYVPSPNGLHISAASHNCTEGSWKALDGSPSCRFCDLNTTLICEGQEVYSLPLSSSLPTRTISLYKLSGVGLISLPPKSFHNLTITQLVIQNSNLSYISTDAFHGANAIKSIHFFNNTLDSLNYMDYLLHDMNNLREINLRHNGLRVLSSTKSANLKMLEYVSLAGNPIYDLDVFFLKNSSLRFLDLRNVKFKIGPSELKDSGFASLPNTLSSVDLSGAEINFRSIQTLFKQISGKSVSKVSLALMDMSKSTSCENMTASLLHIKDTLEYLSMEGIWKSYTYLSTFNNDKQRNIFESGPFTNLKELILKNNNIIGFKDGTFFKAFPNLKSLSLAGNRFQEITSDVFSVCNFLSYIDLRNNYFNEIDSVTATSLGSIKKLDFSHSTFDGDGPEVILSLAENLETLSLCDCKLPSVQNFTLKGLTKLKYLDLSGTITSTDLIQSVNDSFTTDNLEMEELYFISNAFYLTDDWIPMFSSLTKLKKLDLSRNIIKEMSLGLIQPSLETLNLAYNYVGTWYSSVIPPGSKIKSLDLSNNQITFISTPMLEDFQLSSLVNINNNPLLCNDAVVGIVCSPTMNKTVPVNFTLVQSEDFQCYDISTGNQLMFSEPDACTKYYTKPPVTSQAPSNRSIINPTAASPVVRTQNMILTYSLVLGVGCLVLVMLLVALNWWRIKLRIHRYLSMRRARLLKREAEPLSKHQVQYDVFVSYSDVDRSWVLDHLVPNLEKEGDVSLCFHERDFQVGLGILENIIECMDRSHSLLLVVSSAFVRSKWCQFEMHLAQYRLIETFREQLVLVMLEDIPRKNRPQTLHHLMMTKTYLIWPQQPCKDDATELFWRRLKRALKPTSFYNIFNTDYQ